MKHTNDACIMGMPFYRHHLHIGADKPLNLDMVCSEPVTNVVLVVEHKTNVQSIRAKGAAKTKNILDETAPGIT